MNPTERVLIGMLKENTGSHMLDSGGAYGRNWERNQKRDFMQEPAFSLEMNERNEKVDICLTHNVFHFLKDRLEYSAGMQQRFNNHAKKHEDDPWLQVMESFPEYLSKSGEVTGLYGEGDPQTYNTYNGEDMLSQTLQYLYFEFNGEGHVLLQIHGGCDVRGGYTAPKAFRVLDEAAIFDNARATIYCERCSANWYTDDSYHYYFDGSSAGTELQNYSAIELEEVPVPASINPDLFEKGETVGGDYEHQGTVVIVDRQGYCPRCGGKLTAC